MAESQYTAPATYNITFPSLSQAEVKVSVNGAELSTSNYSISNYSTSGSGTVTISSTVANGDIVRIFRDTDITTPEAVFAPGASIKANDLNENNQQLRYKLEEKIDESNIATAAVVTDALRDLNVTREKIADLAINNAKIADDAVALRNMQDNSVDTAELVDASVVNSKLADNSVSLAKMQDNSVDTAEIVDSAVVNSKLADNSVSLAKMQDNSVDTPELVDAAVTNAKLEDNSVSLAKMQDNSVDTAELVADAVTEPKLAANSVTNRQIADGSIDGAKLTDNTLDVDKIKGLDIVTTAEQNAGSPTWAGVDGVLASIGAIERRHDVLYQNSTPSGTDWATGKLWYAHGQDQTLSVWSGSNWIGISSGGTFVTQPTVIWVDQANGSDTNDGHRIIDAMKTIKAAVASADHGDIVLVAPGVYREQLPIDITKNNVSIIGQSLRSCFIHPTPATELTMTDPINNQTVSSVMFRVNSGTQIANFSMAGLKASGENTRGGHPVDSNSTYGLPTTQAWAISFYPNATVYKSPYVQNCTTFMDSAIPNWNKAEYDDQENFPLATSYFDPNNVSQGGFGGDRTSAPTGGGLFIDGNALSTSSPLRSMVVDSFTQINLDGPGALVCNNAYAQFVSFFGTFCHYHCKSLNGGRVNLSNCTTDYGRYGLIADGKSTSALYSGTVRPGSYSGTSPQAGDLYVDITKATAPSSWFGSGAFSTRPTDDMMMQIGSDLYALTGSDKLNSSGVVDPNETNPDGYRVHVIRTAAANRSVNLGLINNYANNASVSFFFRSYISSGGHTFEYVGAGTDYDAAPENGGQPIELNRYVELNNGAVWQSSTDHNGKFTVGNFMEVDQKSGLCNINNINGLAFPLTDGSANNVLSTNGSGTLTWQSISQLGGSGILNLNEDDSPQLGEDLDVVTYDIISTGNRDIDLDPGGSGSVVIKGNSTRGSGDITLNCEQNSHGVKIKGPAHSAAATYTLTLPTALPSTTGQALTSDTNGNLGFSAVSSDALTTPQTISSDREFDTANTNYGLMGPQITVASTATVTVDATSVLTIIN